MLYLKTNEEIEIMRIGGEKLRSVTKELLPFIHVGTTTESIDERAEKLIRAQGGEPSFKRVKGYHWSTCLPINEQVVHTPPSKRVLKEGDVLTVDVGMYYKGFHTDWATTIIVGKPKDVAVERFLNIGKDTLTKAITASRLGNTIDSISAVIEKEIYGHGYHILHELTGHGVGKELHEEPFVPGYVDKSVKKTQKLRPGMTLAIEVIYSMGTEDIDYEQNDEWSIITKDHSLSACFEETVAITDKNSFILT